MTLKVENRRTTLGPHVNRLPLEVLGDILLFSRDYFPSSLDRYRRAALLESTCKCWHSVVENTPAFWRDIDPQYPRRLVIKILSKGFPLAVFWNPTSWWSIDENFKRILAAKPRWVTFNVADALDETSFAQLQAPGCVPLLESFILNASRHDVECPLDLFGGDAPRLKDLQLRWCSIKWDSGLLHNLKSLVLSDIYEFPPTKQELAQVLSQNPELQTLRLKNIQFNSTNTLFTIQPVVLPRVTTLELQGQTIGTLASLLEMVRTPTCRTMDVEANYDGSEGRFSGCLHRHLTPVIKWGKRYMREARYAEVIMSEDDGFRLIASDIETTSPREPGVDGRIPRNFDLTLNGPIGAEEVLSFVADMLSCTTQDMIEVSLSCSIMFLDDTENQFLPTTSNFPGVTSLYIERESGLPVNYADLGPKLARPITAHDGSRKWLYPQLKKLTYTRGILDGGDFLDVLRSRHNPLPGDPTPTPARIDGVIFYDMTVLGWTENLKGEIEAIIGEGKLTLLG